MMITARRKCIRDSLSVTLRKAYLRKQRMVAFSERLVREAGLADCAFVAFVLDGDEMRLKPMKKGEFMGQQIHRISKDGKREHGGIWTRHELLPEELFPTGAYPARIEKGWIVVTLPGAEKKYRQHQKTQKLAHQAEPAAD